MNFRTNRVFPCQVIHTVSFPRPHSETFLTRKQQVLNIVTLDLVWQNHQYQCIINARIHRNVDWIGTEHFQKSICYLNYKHYRLNLTRQKSNRREKKNKLKSLQASVLGCDAGPKSPVPSSFFWSGYRNYFIHTDKIQALGWAAHGSSLHSSSSWTEPPWAAVRPSVRPWLLVCRIPAVPDVLRTAVGVQHTLYAYSPLPSLDDNNL